MNAAMTQVFEKAVLVAPHPVAVAAGRVLRARTLVEQLDAILRTGEALTRYTAALALASLSARTDPTIPSPAGLADFNGPLSWGHFLAVIEVISALPEESHPLSATLRAAFQTNKAGSRPAFDPLVRLLSIRNELGHELQSISAAKAETVFNSQAPEQLLVEALNSLNRVLGLPVFLLDDQQYNRGQFHARRLLLMGESENPIPDEIVLTHGLHEKGALYVGLPQGVLSLWPWLYWHLAERRATYAVYVIHRIDDNLIRFKSMYGDDLDRNSTLQKAVVALRAGHQRPAESSSLSGGASFLSEWTELRRQQEQMLAQRGGPVPWGLLDAATVAWFAARLPDSTRDVDTRTAMQATLLNGRDFLRADEIAQMILLFGSDEAVAQTLGREMLDCRAVSVAGQRWDDRVIVQRNIIESLRTAVQFLGRHVGIDGANLDGLDATSGAADYIAMREALINLFIHQDYRDESAAAQIEIAPDRAMFFNTGKSLIGKEKLVDGGKSQSRNPLIARALRLIGFAELAGSGLRMLQDAWRREQRRPPRFESNPSANTFTLYLDWRKVPVVVDSFWKERIGASVSPQQAQILSLLAAPEGFTDVEVASGTGILFEDLKSDLEYLQVQGLVELRGSKYLLRDYLRSLVLPGPESE